MDFLFNLSKYLWIVICVILLIVYYKKKTVSFNVLKKLILLWGVVIFFQCSFNYTYTYFVWKNDQILRHLVPPESDYLFISLKKYVLTGYLQTIAVALIISLVLFYFARKSREKYLTMNEVALVFFGGLIVSWSNVIVFLVSAVVFNVLGYLGLMLFKKIKPGEILFFTPFIILAIIFTLIYGYRLSYMTGLY